MVRRLLLAVIVCAAIGGALSTRENTAGGALAQPAQPRVVLFELFDSTCPACVTAGSAVETLAEECEQAGRPVLFIEYYSSVFLGNRLDRWYDAYPDWRYCYLPLELVDSGWRASCAPKDYLAVYRDFVEQALANPAGADVTAWYERSGNDLDVRVRVTNRSGVALGSANYATVNVIVYEQTKVLNTGRFARAAADLPVDAVLPDGHEATYRLQLTGVPVGQWDRAVVVALLDYRPHAASTQYEALQAAIAVEGAPPTATATPTATRPPTPTRPTTPTATPVWTDEPVFLPFTM